MLYCGGLGPSFWPSDRRLPFACYWPLTQVQVLTQRDKHHRYPLTIWLQTVVSCYEYLRQLPSNLRTASSRGILQGPATFCDWRKSSVSRSEVKLHLPYSKNITKSAHYRSVSHICHHLDYSAPILCAHFVAAQDQASSAVRFPSRCAAATPKERQKHKENHSIIFKTHTHKDDQLLLTFF